AGGAGFSRHENTTSRNNDSQTGQILKMIRDVGIAKRINILESEHGEQCSNEYEKTRQRAAMATHGNQQETNSHAQTPREEQILPPVRRIYGPVRISEHQVRRPNQ